MVFSTLARVFRRNRDYYFIYDKRLPFVFALMFGRFLIETAFINVLMWYFTYYGLHLAKSAILSNITDSLSSFLVLCMMIIGDSCVGRFRALLFSNTAYVGGLLLMWWFDPFDVGWLVMVALVLLALGSSGSYLLEGITFDLMGTIDTTQDQTKERSLARPETVSRIANVCGSICATLWVTPDALGGVFPTWKTTICVCIITMTVCSMIFCTGYQSYDQNWLTERPDWIVLRVLGARVQKLLMCNSWCLIHTARQQRRLPQNMENEVIPQDIALHLDRVGQERVGEHRVIWKSLLRMVPMWVTYLVVSAISATGSTFFFEQYNNLNTVNKIPIQIYDLVQKLTRFGIPYVYQFLSCSHKNCKVKIGVGMLCALICCVLAWQLEVHRLKVVQHLVNQDANSSLSFLWLVPQFFVHGCMEGLTREGLLKFSESQINDERLKIYAEDYLEFVMGAGKLIHIFLILIIQSQKGWFGNTINDSRLDKYYLLLVKICLANFIFYCCITLWFYKHAEETQVQANGDSPQNQQLLVINDSQQDHGLVIRDTDQLDNPLVIQDTSQADHPLVTGKDESQQDHGLVIRDTDHQLENPLVIQDTSQADHPLVTVKNESQQDHGPVIRDTSQVDHPLVPVKDDSQQDHQLMIKDHSEQTHQSLSDEESHAS